MLALRFIVAFYFPLLCQAQLISSLPQCIRDCIAQSQFGNCQAVDIGCLCRASAGNFLPDLLNCMRGKCDLDARVLLEPLQAVCLMAGAPIPDKALQNAEDLATSVQQVTATVTVGATFETGDSYTLTTFDDGYYKATTTTEMVTEEDGLTITMAYPVTVWRTATVSGPESTISSSIHSSTSATSHNEHSKSTTSITQSTPHSALTSLVATTLKGAQTSSSSSSSSSVSKATTTPVISQDESNSSPFKDSNSSGSKRGVGISMWLTGLVAMARIWF